MSGGELAGRLRARVLLERMGPGRDALGAGGAWAETGLVWAEMRPEGRGAAFVGEARAAMPAWRATLRRCDVAIGDRVTWASLRMIVREVRDDPALPDRIVAVGEQER